MAILNSVMLIILVTFLITLNFVMNQQQNEAYTSLKAAAENDAVQLGKSPQEAAQVAMPAKQCTDLLY